MRILSRYVFRQTAGALLLILVSLTGVVWIAVALRQLELMTTQGQDVLRFLAMTTLAIPSMMALIAPDRPADRLHPRAQPAQRRQRAHRHDGGRHAGLVAAEAAGAAGAAGRRSASPASTMWRVRGRSASCKELAVQVRTDLMAQIIQPWRFTSPEAKLTVHIRDRAPNGELLGLLMHDARDPKQIVTYLAERARIIKQGGQAYLRMDKGHIVRRLENEPSPQIIAFERYAVDVNQLEQRSRSDRQSCGRASATPTSSCSPIPNDPIYKTNPGQLRLRAARALRQPALRVRLRAVVLAFMGQAQTTRTSRMQAVICAFAVAVLCRILGITCANVVVVRPAAAPLLYAVPAGGRRAGRDRDPVAALSAAAARGSRAPSRGLLERIGARPAGLVAAASSAGARAPGRGASAPCSGPRTLRRYVAKRFLLSILRRVRGLRRADLHDRHDRAAAAVAARHRPVHGVACCGWRCCGCRRSRRSCWRSPCWSAASARC